MSKYIDKVKEALQLITIKFEGEFTNKTNLIKVGYSLTVKNFPSIDNYITTSFVADNKVKLFQDKTMNEEQLVKHLENLNFTAVTCVKSGKVTAKVDKVDKEFTYYKLTAQVSYPEFKAGMENRNKGKLDSEKRQIIKTIDKLGVRVQVETAAKDKLENLDLIALKDYLTKIQEALKSFKL